MSVQIDPLESMLVTLMREERERQRISVNKLATKAGISPSTIAHVEDGSARPTLWVSLRMAQGLGRSFASFVDEATGKLGR